MVHSVEKTDVLKVWDSRRSHCGKKTYRDTLDASTKLWLRRIALCLLGLNDRSVHQETWHKLLGLFLSFSNLHKLIKACKSSKKVCASLHKPTKVYVRFPDVVTSCANVEVNQTPSPTLNGTNAPFSVLLLYNHLTWFLIHNSKCDHYFAISIPRVLSFVTLLTFCNCLTAQNAHSTTQMKHIAQ